MPRSSFGISGAAEGSSKMELNGMSMESIRISEMAKHRKRIVGMSVVVWIYIECRMKGQDSVNSVMDSEKFGLLERF
jgi:hypothetical protein